MLRKYLTIGLLAAAVVIPSIAEAATGYVSSRTRMRAGPDNGYPTVATVRRGEGVRIHACLADRSWCDVGFEGERGWLPGRAIMGETVRGRVPIATMSRQDYGTTRFNLDEYWDTNYHGRFDRRRGHWQGYWRDRDRDGTPDRRDDYPRNPNRD